MRKFVLVSIALLFCFASNSLAANNPFLYNGAVYDAEVSLYSLPEVAYSYSLKRSLQLAAPSSPSLNPYTFGAGQPLNLTPISNGEGSDGRIPGGGPGVILIGGGPGRPGDGISVIPGTVPEAGATPGLGTGVPKPCPDPNPNTRTGSSYAVLWVGAIFMGPGFGVGEMICHNEQWYLSIPNVYWTAGLACQASNVPNKPDCDVCCVLDIIAGSEGWKLQHMIPIPGEGLTSEAASAYCEQLKGWGYSVTCESVYGELNGSLYLYKMDWWCKKKCLTLDEAIQGAIDRLTMPLVSWWDNSISMPPGVYGSMWEFFCDIDDVGY